MRHAAMAVLAAGLAGCATTTTGVETSGALPPLPASLGLAASGADAPNAREAMLAARAEAALREAGRPVAGAGSTPAATIRLAFAARPERLGAFVPRAGADAAWAARPARRGFLAPSRVIYSVELVAFDSATGAEQARARATARQRQTEPDRVLAGLADTAARALAAPAP